MGKKAHQKKKKTQRNSDSLPLSGSTYLDSKSPQIEDEQANEALDKIIYQQDLFNKRESALKEEVISVKAQLECVFRVHQML